MGEDFFGENRQVQISMANNNYSSGSKIYVKAFLRKKSEKFFVLVFECVPVKLRNLQVWVFDVQQIQRADSMKVEVIKIKRNGKTKLKAI